MLGPEGAGFLFVRESNLDGLEPLMQGWGSLQMAHQFQTSEMVLKKDASRYEGGSANHAGLIGLSESLGLLLQLGCNRKDNPVANAVLENAVRIEEGLRRLGVQVHRARSESSSDAELSGIMTFTVPNRSPMEVRRHLLQREIVTSVRHERLRVATHAYNNEDDIGRLIEAVRDCNS
jgi:selenocysteine lyase/cysteine desulfurase